MRKAQSGLVVLAMTSALTLVVVGDAVGQKKNRDVITREELQTSALHTRDVYQAIRSLRPHMLAGPRGNRSLGGARPAPTALYVDGNRMGELDGLKMIMTEHVQEVRYLEPAKAEDQFGIGHSGGAVLVTLFKGQRPDTARSNPPPPRH